MARIVLTKGLVFDGTGTPPRAADVTIDGDRVVAVTDGWAEHPGADDPGADRTRADRTRADRVIDASGCTVLPGLIESSPSQGR